MGILSSDLDLQLAGCTAKAYVSFRGDASRFLTRKFARSTTAAKGLLKECLSNIPIEQVTEENVQKVLRAFIREDLVNKFHFIHIGESGRASTDPSIWEYMCKETRYSYPQGFYVTFA